MARKQPQPIAVQRTSTLDGRLVQVRIDWHDAEFVKLSSSEVSILHSVAVAFLFFAAFAMFSGKSAGAVMWVAFAAALFGFLECDVRRWRPTRYVHRACTFKADGRMVFHLPLPDSDMPTGCAVGDFLSVEYGATQQWRAREDRQYGDRKDVYGLMEDGRRFVFARHTWEGEVSHEMALLFGRTLREIQEGLTRPAKIRAQVHKIVID